jgi:hypothetical protein
MSAGENQFSIARAASMKRPRGQEQFPIRQPAPHMQKEHFLRALFVASVLLASPVRGADPATPRPAQAVADAMTLAPPGTTQLQGWLGDKIDLCLNRRVWAQNPGLLVAVLRNHNDKDNWRGEYWGKWYSAAVLAYACHPTAERRAQLEKVMREVIKIQAPDGYLGPYEEKDRLTVWDVWCRKYVLLGLLAAYDLTGDSAALEAARRNADNLIDDLDRRKLKIVEIGVPVLKGVANSSIIEPMALLYQQTSDRKYLAFAQSIIAQWNAPSSTAPEGIRLLEKALEGAPPLKNHCYAIMSCFEGICELYRATGDRRYLDAAVGFGQSVRRHERMIVGSASNHELFCEGARGQTEFLEKPEETCVTVTWIKLCAQLLRLTGVEQTDSAGRQRRAGLVRAGKLRETGSGVGAGRSSPAHAGSPRVRFAGPQRRATTGAEARSGPPGLGQPARAIN